MQRQKYNPQAGQEAVLSHDIVIFGSR